MYNYIYIVNYNIMIIIRYYINHILYRFCKYIPMAGIADIQHLVSVSTVLPQVREV